MGVGLQIFNASGAVVVDTNTRVGRFFGSFATNGAESGSLTDARLIGGELLVCVTNTGNNDRYGGPYVTLNKATGRISWDYTITTEDLSGGGPVFRQHLIYYGRY